MEWTKTDPENLPKGHVIFTDGSLLYVGFFDQNKRFFYPEDYDKYRKLKNSYYIELPPLPEAK